MNISIVYMVAGISSRFGSIKQFVNVAENQTLIGYSMSQALKAGFNKIYFIVGNKTETPFREKFGNSFKGIPIVYVLQTYDEKTRDKPWGTVDAICSLKKHINEPFVVCNGDDIYGGKTFQMLYNHLQKSNEEATAGYTLINVLPATGKTNRAIFKENQGYVADLQETFEIEKSNLSSKNLSPQDLCSMNIFAFHPSTVFLLDERLQAFKLAHKTDRKIEALLPNEIGTLIKKGKIKMRLYPTKDIWLGVTNPGDEFAVKKWIENPGNK